MATLHPPVVFIHSLWLHSTSWQNWVEHVSEAGYDPSALTAKQFRYALSWLATRNL